MTTQRTSGRRKQAFAAAPAVAALLTTAACGGGGSDNNGSKTGAAGFDAANNKVAQASLAKKGGTLRFGGAQDADSWDTTRGYYGFMWNFARYYSRQLVTGKTEPARPAPSSPRTSPPVSPRSRTTARRTPTPCATASRGGRSRSRPGRQVRHRARLAQDVLSGGPTYLKDFLDPKGEYKGP